MKFTVKRSDWFRGQGGFRSKLLNPINNKMCCLGFYALAKGAKREDIMDRAAPNSCPDQPWSQDLIASSFNTISTESLINTNDSPALCEAEREERLTILFSNIDVQVEFVD